MRLYLDASPIIYTVESNPEFKDDVLHWVHQVEATAGLLVTSRLALLECLVLHPGQVVDRATITAHVWDENHDPFTNVLEVLVRRLRRKVDDGSEQKLIHTLRGVGYRLGAEG